MLATENSTRAKGAMRKSATIKELFHIQAATDPDSVPPGIVDSHREEQAVVADDTACLLREIQGPCT